MINVGIDCETIEDGHWGVARIISKLLQELAKRPELAARFRFHLYFKARIPELPYLDSPLFVKKIVRLPLISGILDRFAARSFSIYYYILLPVRLWFEGLDVMYFPNYMLPIIFRGASIVDLTEDAYYEAWYGSNPFRYKLAYRIFCWWAAKFATRIEAMSQTSKRNVARVYKISEDKIIANYHGIDLTPRLPISEKGDYLLYFGQAFPRRHLRETMLAFEKIAPRFPKLKLIAIGHDKYSPPIIDRLVQGINKRLGSERIIHKGFAEQDELECLIQKAKASIYVSEVEAFGLPALEALYYGTVPVVADTELTHELLGPNVFFVEHPKDIDDFARTLVEALTDTDKQATILKAAPEILKKYTWKAHTDRFLEIVKNIVT